LISRELLIANLKKCSCSDGCFLPLFFAAWQEKMTGIVRRERDADVDAIRDVHRAAFGRAAEAQLVDALRAGGNLLVSLVMDCGGVIVGHVAFSPVRIEEEVLGVGLAPLGVAPGFQRRGIGNRLVHEGLAECRRAGFGIVVVLGDPLYYRRFGFAPARGMNLANEYGAGDEFMSLRLQPSSSLKGGLIRYSPEFALVS
jgi:putative acetyltransferase